MKKINNMALQQSGSFARRTMVMIDSIGKGIGTNNPLNLFVLLPTNTTTKVA
jgi:hypothetical protein